MRVLENCKPENVFRFFEEICAIPHGSYNTDAISDYCVKFAKDRGLYCRQEECGNVIIKKPATAGYENSDAVIIQGHLDMVAVKNPGCTKDMMTEGLDLCIDGDWIYAKDTTLGGDDGIAIAIALAVLDDKSLEHPPIEAVFTVGEEVGLIGAGELSAHDLNGKTLLNLDSEESGVFLAGCAGGGTIECVLPVKFQYVEGSVFEISITGLTGGHSGVEINKGRANAIDLMGRCLAQMDKKIDWQLSEIDGGDKDNAIGTWAKSVIIINPYQEEILQQHMEWFSQNIKRLYADTDPGMIVELNKVEGKGRKCVSYGACHALTKLLIHLPYGVQKLMPEMPEVVQTSLNKGILRTASDNIKLTISVRSAVEDELSWLIEKVTSLVRMVGGYATVNGVYPAWEYSSESRIRDLMLQAYKEVTGKDAKVEVIHAGVECGLFQKKLPGIDCISFGPDIVEIHTPRERMSISTVADNYQVVLKVLKNLK